MPNEKIHARMRFLYDVDFCQQMLYMVDKYSVKAFNPNIRKEILL